MFKLQAIQSESTKEIVSEVFVIGDLHLATTVARKLLVNTNCEIVEVLKKAKGEIVAVLTKTALTAL